MKTRLTLKSRKLVDQVFKPGRGWIELPRALAMRHLSWKKNASKFNGATAVHFVTLGDFKISELTKRAA
jgi:hypothetical protein